jgi:hypothetical protein
MAAPSVLETGNISSQWLSFLPSQILIELELSQEVNSWQGLPVASKLIRYGFSIYRSPVVTSYRGRILRRNWDKILKSFPPCYSQSPLLTDPPPSKCGLKLVCNVSIVYGNLRSENSQDYVQKPQRNCIVHEFGFCIQRGICWGWRYICGGLWKGHCMYIPFSFSINIRLKKIILSSVSLYFLHVIKFWTAIIC